MRGITTWNVHIVFSEKPVARHNREHDFSPHEKENQQRSEDDAEGLSASNREVPIGRRIISAGPVGRWV
jgi:hypothetical protein